MKTILSLLVLFSAHAGGASSVATSIELPVVADIHSMIITEVDIGGEKFKFLLDTGSKTHVLSPAFAAKFKDTLLEEKSGQESTPPAYLLRLKIKDLDFGSMTAIELDTRRFSVNQDGIDCCDGILGNELFRKYPIEIDRVSKKITLNSTAKTSDKDWIKVPLKQMTDQSLILNCTSSLGSEVAFRLETGSEIPLTLHSRFIAQHAVHNRLETAGSAKQPIPMVSFGTIKCAGNMPGVRIDALVPTADLRASLDNSFDGRINGAVLGRRYLIDTKQEAVFLRLKDTDSDVRISNMGEGRVIELSPARLDEYFHRLSFLPIQDRIRKGLGGLSKREMFSVGQLLMTSASASNEELGFKLLQSISAQEVPCIDYYRAEYGLRKGRYESAKKAIDEFLKTKPIACEGEKRNFYSCCPASKYRNASGLKKLIETRLKEAQPQDLTAKLTLTAEALKLKAPVVTWKGVDFLIDTGAEHNVWNSSCRSELKLKTDTTGSYGGADSVGKTVVAHFAQPEAKVLDLPQEALLGFAMDLSASQKDYGGKRKLCGILSPQRIIPKGLMVFDWTAKALLFCQGDACRKALDIPVNCPMYMFNGRPYFDLSINSQEPRLFLVDTGANSTSANLNYFTIKPKTSKTDSLVKGASGTSTAVDVIPEAEVRMCGSGFRLKPFSVRAASQDWEWHENGKIGMNILFESLIALDFGKGGALMK